MANITKRKVFKHLTVFDRTVIGQKYKEGLSFGRIAQIINRPKSSVWREIKRHKTKEFDFYRADVAHQKTMEKRGRRGVRPILKNEMIRAYALEKLKLLCNTCATLGVAQFNRRKDYLIY